MNVFSRDNHVQSLVLVGLNRKTKVLVEVETGYEQKGT